MFGLKDRKKVTSHICDVILSGRAKAIEAHVICNYVKKVICRGWSFLESFENYDGFADRVA